MKIFLLLSCAIGTLPACLLALVLFTTRMSELKTKHATGRNVHSLIESIGSQGPGFSFQFDAVVVPSILGPMLVMVGVLTTIVGIHFMLRFD